MLLLPGLALALPLSLRYPLRSLPFTVILAAALSLALNALLLLLVPLVVPLTPLSLGVSYGIVAGLGAVWAWREWQTGGLELRAALTGDWPWGLALAALFVAVFALRWVPLAGLPVPPGFDSVHHVATVDLILRNEGLPSGYLPYWDLQDFTYHFGFHANAALLALVGGAPAHEAILWLGPYLVALTGLGMYALLYAVTRSPRAAALGAVAIGLLSVFPAFYLVWGRYPQLAGVAIVLPTLAYLLPLRRSSLMLERLLVAGVLVAGLALTHYRMFVLLLFGFGALLAVRAWEERRLRPVADTALRLAGVLGVALLLILPWVLNLLDSVLARAVIYTSPGTPPPTLYSLDRLQGPLAFPTFHLLAALSVLGGLLTALRRQVDFLLLASWAALSWFFSSRLHATLPGFGLLDPVTWVSITFVFQAGFVATGVLVVAEALRARPRWKHAAFAVAAAGLILAGAVGTGVIVAEEEALVVTEADLRAFAWIREHVPEDAVFATNVGLNPFWQGAEPRDAGVWITYHTGRSQLAPSYNAAFERPAPWYVEALRGLPSHMARIDSFASYLFLRDVGATHLYLGALQTGPMDADQVAASPWFVPLYQEDNVTIARLVDLDEVEPLVLRGGQDWSFLLNGTATTRPWEPSGLVVEAYTFQEFRAEYPLYFAAPGRYRLSFHLADFVAVDWETGQPLSGLRFRLDGAPLLEHEYGADEIRWLTVDLEVQEAGVATLTVENRDAGLPFRISLGGIQLESLGP